MRYFLLVALGCGAFAGCTKLDEPFEGLPADALTLTVDSVAVPLRADGYSTRRCVVRLNANAILFKNAILTVSSGEVQVSKYRDGTEKGSSVTVPLTNPEGTFYIVAPRDVLPTVRVTAAISNASTSGSLPIVPSFPDQIELTSPLLRTSVGTPVNLEATLRTTGTYLRSVSGKLSVQAVPVLAANDPSAVLGPLLSGRTVADDDGSARFARSFVAVREGNYYYVVRLTDHPDVISPDTLKIICQP